MLNAPDRVPICGRKIENSGILHSPHPRWKVHVTVTANTEATALAQEQLFRQCEEAYIVIATDVRCPAQATK